MYGFRPFTDGSLFFGILTMNLPINCSLSADVVIQSVSKIVNSLIQIEETRTICEKKERSTFHVSES